MQTPEPPPPSPDLLERLAAIGWFDWTAIAVVTVFLVLGLWKGLRWQLGRLAVLVLAYGVAIAAGPALAATIGAWFTHAGDPAVALHVARAILFVAVLALVGLALWLVQRFLEPRPLTGQSRLLGAALGAVSGALAMLALLTALQMFLGERAVARAAETSATSRLGRGALALAERVLPEPYADGARDWRALLRDPALEPAPDADPGRRDAGAPPADGTAPAGPPPRRALDPGRVPGPDGRR
jgi:uncharacterized membrane protein required for colicin V production